MKPVSFAVAVAALAGIGTAAHATQKAEKIAITADSKRAVLILKTVDVPIAPPYQTGYRLALRVYDAENQAMRGGPLGGGATFQAKPSLFYDGYLVMDVKPGTYVISEFSRQDSWALCFHDNSVQFTVGAGEAVYLGDFDARAHVAELERNAILSGRLTSSGGLVHFFDDITPPRLKTIDDTQLAAAGRMMQARMQKTTVPIRAAEYLPARFGTGSDLFGMNRVCGGYYTGPAKPAA